MGDGYHGCLYQKYPPLNLVIYQDKDSTFDFRAMTTIRSFNTTCRLVSVSPSASISLFLGNVGSFHRDGQGGLVNWSYHAGDEFKVDRDAGGLDIKFVENS